MGVVSRVAIATEKAAPGGTIGGPLQFLARFVAVTEVADLADGEFALVWENVREFKVARFKLVAAELATVVVELFDRVLDGAVLPVGAWQHRTTNR